MQTRELGQSGIKVAPLAFGGNVFGWTADEATSFTLLDRFVDAGLNLVDTADVYSRWIPGHVGGESETIIGKWLRQSGKRDRVVIATKCAMEMGEGESGLSRAYIMRAVERSLQRLQTDYIDLYQSHRDDENTPQEETLGAYAELIAAGKVRAIGASNFSAARLADALAISARLGLPRYETLQPNYNLYDRAEFEAELGTLLLPGLASFVQAGECVRWLTQGEEPPPLRPDWVPFFPDLAGPELLRTLAARHPELVERLCAEG